MIRKAWCELVSPGMVKLIMLASWLSLLSPGSQAVEDKNAVKVESVQAYLARHIETGEVVGHFFHVQARAVLEGSTRARLDMARGVPIYVAARLDVNGKQFMPCGSGSVLTEYPWTPSLIPPEAGEPISPLFYVPEGALVGGLNVVELIMVLENAGPGPPLARAPVPWTQELVKRAGDGWMDLIGVETEATPDQKAAESARLVQAVQLRLPAGFRRVLFWGSGKLHCGSEPAKDMSLGSPVVARFVPPIDAVNCRWELRFPDLDVKLDLAVNEP